MGRLMEFIKVITEFVNEKNTTKLLIMLTTLFVFLLTMVAVGYLCVLSNLPEPLSNFVMSISSGGVGWFIYIKAYKRFRTYPFSF